MAGIEFTGGELVVDRPANDLDELAIRFTEILDDLGIDHVAGYVAILTGRSRSTEDIDVLLEHIDTETVERLTSRLEREGMWGPAMPLDSMDEMLEDNIWVARDGEMVPHLEVKFVADRLDRASLDSSIVAKIAGAELPIGPLELQIAYKLWLGGDTDFADAVHLYAIFGESLRKRELERWVEDLGIEEEYDRLERA